MDGLGRRANTQYTIIDDENPSHLFMKTRAGPQLPRRSEIVTRQPASGGDVTN